MRVGGCVGRTTKTADVFFGVCFGVLRLGNRLRSLKNNSNIGKILEKVTVIALDLGTSLPIITSSAIQRPVHSLARPSLFSTRCISMTLSHSVKRRSEPHILPS
jgi:hypothetical protein